MSSEADRLHRLQDPHLRGLRERRCEGQQRLGPSETGRSGRPEVAPKGRGTDEVRQRRKPVAECSRNGTRHLQETTRRVRAVRGAPDSCKLKTGRQHEATNTSIKFHVLHACKPPSAADRSIHVSSALIRLLVQLWDFLSHLCQLPGTSSQLHSDMEDLSWRS